MVTLPGGYFLEADDMEIRLVKIKDVKDKKTGEIKPGSAIVAHQTSVPAILGSWYRMMSRDLISKPNMIELKELLAQMNALSNEVLRTIGTLTYSGGRLSASAPSTPLPAARTNKPKGTDENGL